MKYSKIGSEREASIESVINWLLENPDLSSHGDTPPDPDLGTEEASAASGGGGDGGRPRIIRSSYLRHLDFANSDDYAAYVRDHISIGMQVIFDIFFHSIWIELNWIRIELVQVRCCRSYDDLVEGDIGNVVQLDRDGLHDLNLQVSFIFFIYLFIKFILFIKFKMAI